MRPAARPLEEYEKRIGYRFQNKELLETALTHSSFANEHKCKSYERLEFLGDSVLGFVTAEYLFEHFPQLPEGQLTKTRAGLVCERSLCGFSKALHVGDFLRLSHGERHSGGRERPSILADVFESVKRPGDRFAGAAFTSGSAGTMSAGDLLKERYPHLKLAVGEALQCPTILDNGFGGHRIEGIGDKHIPWIHNVKNTDMAIAIDDEDSQRLLRLFNTPEGKTYMKDELGMSDEEVEKMAWLGISGIANVLCCIKMAKYYELTENDVVGTVLTDSAVMYQSRIDELNQLHGAYNAHEAAMDHARHMLDLKTDSMLELTYTERKRVHNLKYYTWVEQQGMNVEDLNAQWYDTKNTWDAVHAQAKELDELINEFNEATGLLKAL